MLMAKLGCFWIAFGLFTGPTVAILISDITKCQTGIADPRGAMKVQTVQVCNLFGNTCVMNQVETASADCATKALVVENQQCALFPIMSYKNYARSDATQLQVGAYGCSISCSGSDCKFSGGCVSVQCKTDATTWVGLGKTGSNSGRTTGVADSSVASAFEAHHFATFSTYARQSKTVFLSRTGNFVATYSRAGSSSGTNAYVYGNLPTSDGSNYGPKACETTTLSSATAMTQAEITMCGSIGKWAYFNGVNLLMDKNMYVQTSGDSASGLSKTKTNSPGSIPFLAGESLYKSGAAMDDTRQMYIYNGATATGDPLLTSAEFTPAKSENMATPTPDIAGTWRSYTVVFYCADYARTDLTACTSNAIFYVADPNPTAQFATPPNVGSLFGGAAGGGSNDASGSVRAWSLWGVICVMAASAQA